MALGGDSGAAGAVYQNVLLGKVCFQKQGVGNHADVRTQSNKLQV